MSHFAKCAAVLLMLSLAISVAAAQAQGNEKDYNLTRTVPDSLALSGQDEDLLAEAHVPQIRAGEIEASLTLGYLNLETTLWSHPQVIYKVTDEDVSWGDVALIGKQAFNPIVRLNYNVTSWFAIEPLFNFSVSEYEASITNRRLLELSDDDAEIVENPPLDEFDAERRSVVTYGGGVNALIYPLNLVGDAKGRWHPYLAGGISRIWYDLNSSYTASAAAHNVYSGGGGIRLIADAMISIRMEVMYSTTEIQFDVSEAFDVFNEGTLRIPVYEFEGSQAIIVEEYATHKISNLSWGLGFVANF